MLLRGRLLDNPDSWVRLSETAVGGIFIKERCENKLPDRLIKLEIDLYRTAGQDLSDFVNRTWIEIRPSS